MSNTNTVRVAARTAELTASDDVDDEDDGPWTFSGIAVAAGDILYEADGTPILFTEEELRAAADTQTGEPLSKDHPSDEDGNPIYPPPTDDTVGKVSAAGYVDDAGEAGGVAYKADTHDPNIAQGVRASSYDVSIHANYDYGEKDPETGAIKAENIRFRDLSVVSKGMSPSNTAEWGANYALASATRSGQISEQLADQAGEATAAAAADDRSIRERVADLARDVGLLPSEDLRGEVWVSDQTTDGETIAVDRATFDDAAWMLCAHLKGDEYPDVGPGLGPSIGEGQPHEPGDVVTGDAFEVDEPLEEDSTVYVALHYVSEDGEKLDHIPASDGGYFVDDAFVAVAPDGVEVDDGTDGTVTANEPAESGADPTSNMGSNDDNPDGQDGTNGGTTIAEMTADELFDELEDRGMVTAEDVEDIVRETQQQADKEEMVDEIIQASDDYDEDDREELLASAGPLIESEHQRVTGTATGSPMPGALGSGSATVQAGAQGTDTDEDIGAYGTGVAGEGR